MEEKVSRMRVILLYSINFITRYARNVAKKNKNEMEYIFIGGQTEKKKIGHFMAEWYIKMGSTFH